MNAPHSDTSQEAPAVALTTNSQESWNTSSKFRRPRIFCLEHAIKVQELLQTKGGVNLLVICHSGKDFCQRDLLLKVIINHELSVLN